MKYAARFGLSSALLALVIAGAVAGCGSSGSNPTGAAGTSGQARPYSLSFLRKVARWMPSSAAARLWLPSQ